MRNRLLTLGILLTTFSFAILNGLSAQDQSFEFHKPASMWPKGDYVIIPKRKTRRLRNNIEHLGPTGLWGFRFGQNICVKSIDPGSPADGKVLPDDYIYGANGKDFPTEGDVRFHFANAITEAETKEAGGKLILHIRRNGKLGRISIRLQVMGSFSATTPWNCEKSKNIVARAEEYMLKGLRPEKGIPRNKDYMYNPFYDSVLFLMASGNPKLQGLVRRQIRLVLDQLDAHKQGKKKGGISLDKGWTFCYLSMVLGEYYHLTGDRTVLPYLEDICNRKMRRKGSEPAVAWSPPTGKNRYGLHPHMQMPFTMGLVLANEAGLKINKDRLSFDLRYLNHRRAEYGYVRYCGYPEIHVEARQTDGPMEITEEQKASGKYSPMNGKLGAAAALYSLVNGYEKAVDMCSERSVYAFNSHGGHGGAWFSGFWTPIGAYHAGSKKSQFFMKRQQWWRELYRDHTGAMWQVGNARGKSDTLGTGFAIHRVMHEKRLRILGAPHSYFGANPPPSMKPVLAAHRKRDYARAEKLAKQLLESGKVPAAEKARVSHFLESVQILRKSIEHDLTFTATLLKKGNYVLANVELPQLQMVVSPKDSRLKAIVRALGSSEAKAQISATYAKAEKDLKDAILARKNNRGSKKRNFEQEMSCLVTLVKDQLKHTGPYFGRIGRGILGMYPTYSKQESQRWRLKEVETLRDSPKGWEQPTFDDSEWRETVLPTKTRKIAKPILMRTHFEVNDVNAFKFLRVRMKMGGVSNLTIYLNGGIVAVGDSDYETVVPLEPGALALLRKGKNTLAVGGHRDGSSFFSLRLEGIAKNPLRDYKVPPKQRK